ncbi:MAG TPA: transposase [Thermoanaerobaculia bacterium]|nr:transposase [Thermoanaerobaculia bacterium]
MARQRRLEYPGALYHVISRGIERRDLFRDDVDRKRYLRLLESAVGRFHFRLYAYCLMTNHVHLALEATTVPLSRIMRSINTSYAGYFNVRHKRSGYLFQGRYKALVVDREAYLLSLIRYIHENPVKASMVAKAEEYAWSSHQSYLRKAPAWLAADEVLQRLGSRRSTAVRNFRELFARVEDAPYSDGRAHAQLVVGDEAFADEALKRLPLESSIALRRLAVDRLVEWVARDHGIEPAALYGASRSRHLGHVRAICAYLAPSVGVSVARVARELNRSQPNLWRSAQALARTAETDARFRKVLQRRKEGLIRHANNT